MDLVELDDAGKGEGSPSETLQLRFVDAGERVLPHGVRVVMESVRILPKVVEFGELGGVHSGSADLFGLAALVDEETQHFPGREVLGARNPEEALEERTECYCDVSRLNYVRKVLTLRTGSKGGSKEHFSYALVSTREQERPNDPRGQSTGPAPPRLSARRGLSESRTRVLSASWAGLASTQSSTSIRTRK
jgi:hypothetical protein